MRDRARFGRERGALGGDYWAVAAYLAVPAIGLLLLAIALPPDPAPAFPEERLAELRDRIHDRTRALQEWPRLLAELCRDPRLLEIALGPSCADGTITLAGEDFFDPDTRSLGAAGARRLRIAIPVVLDSLRAHEGIWSRIDAIEVRGHADPRALRDPYATNLRASQDRAASIVLFLTSDSGLRERDRRDLRRLAISSGASHARPPTDCRVRSAECDTRAKRVEIRIALDPGALRARVGDFHDELIEALTP